MRVGPVSLQSLPPIVEKPSAPPPPAPSEAPPSLEHLIRAPVTFHSAGGIVQIHQTQIVADPERTVATMQGIRVQALAAPLPLEEKLAVTEAATREMLAASVELEHRQEAKVEGESPRVDATTEAPAQATPSRATGAYQTEAPRVRRPRVDSHS